MPTILHFADAHIDMANYGRHDPESGLPLRVIDFLKSWTALLTRPLKKKSISCCLRAMLTKIATRLPPSNAERGRCIMRLSRGRHSNTAAGRQPRYFPCALGGLAMETFDTLAVPHVRVIDKPVFLGPEDLEGLPLQVIGLPWVARSGTIAHLGMQGSDPAKGVRRTDRAPDYARPRIGWSVPTRTRPLS